MSSPINKTTLEHLAKLARIELNASEEKKILADLSKILDHFKELQELDTSNVPPMTGGTDLKNIFRDDAEEENPEADASHRYETGTNRGEGVDAFPENERGFLKIPPVFE